MELRKLLAVLLAGLKLLVRKESLLAIGVLTVALVVLIQLVIASGGGIIAGVLAAFTQWGLLLAASPILARRLAEPGGVRGPVFWTGWAVSAVLAIVLNVVAALAATSLMFRLIEIQTSVSMVTPLIALTGGIAMLGWFLPLVHLMLAARGDRSFGPGALPGALAPARAAWLIGAFLLGVAVVFLRIGLTKLTMGSGLIDTPTAARVLASLASAIDLVTVLAFTNAAANFVQRPRGSEADVFA